MSKAIIKDQLEEALKAVVRRETLIEFLEEQKNNVESEEEKDQYELSIGENQKNLDTDKKWLAFLENKAK